MDGLDVRRLTARQARRLLLGRTVEQAHVFGQQPDADGPQTVGLRLSDGERLIIAVAEGIVAGAGGCALEFEQLTDPSLSAVPARDPETFCRALAGTPIEAVQVVGSNMMMLPFHLALNPGPSQLSIFARDDREDRVPGIVFLRAVGPGTDAHEIAQPVDVFDSQTGALLDDSLKPIAPDARDDEPLSDDPRARRLAEAQILRGKPHLAHACLRWPDYHGAIQEVINLVNEGRLDEAQPLLDKWNLGIEDDPAVVGQFGYEFVVWDADTTEWVGSDQGLE
jgi:hypothetical protein